jgi:hypothetical protein
LGLLHQCLQAFGSNTNDSSSDVHLGVGSGRPQQQHGVEFYVLICAEARVDTCSLGLLHQCLQAFGSSLTNAKAQILQGPMYSSASGHAITSLIMPGRAG